MEMGVDIGSVSSVMMTNLPPSIANYRQRVGRATDNPSTASSCIFRASIDGPAPLFDLPLGRAGPSTSLPSWRDRCLGVAFLQFAAVSLSTAAVAARSVATRSSAALVLASARSRSASDAPSIAAAVAASRAALTAPSAAFNEVAKESLRRRSSSGCFLRKRDMLRGCPQADDGLSYPDYVEQLTYLLFLKMADEQEGGPVPDKFGRKSFIDRTPPRCISITLAALGKCGGTLGLIFRNARTKSMTRLNCVYLSLTSSAKLNGAGSQRILGATPMKVCSKKMLGTLRAAPASISRPAR
jgi:hypothetical protein